MFKFIYMTFSNIQLKIAALNLFVLMVRANRQVRLAKSGGQKHHCFISITLKQYRLMGDATEKDGKTGNIRRFVLQVSYSN